MFLPYGMRTVTQMELAFELPQTSPKAHEDCGILLTVMEIEI